MTKVVTFGEIMLRLSPPGNERFFQSATLGATFGGGEANVAVSLAHFGLESWYVTKVPTHAIGEAAVHALRAEGVRTDAIVRGGDRLGVYFAENGASQRASSVVYDRAHSAVAAMRASEVDWASVFTGASWLHVTGITPAISAHGADATRAAIAAARAVGATVSVDLNFRRKLWSSAAAQETMKPLVRGLDVIIANEEDLQTVLGTTVAGADVTSGTLAREAYRVAAEQVSREYGTRYVAITLRESHSASENGWSGVLWDAAGQTLHESRRYDLRIVDRIGGGDSFAAGLIYGLASGRPSAAALEFAVAASALKHSIPGDFNRVTVDEVDRLAAGDASGRVRR